MEIKKTQNGSELTLSVEGRLDTTTAPQLEECLKGSYEGLTKLTLDLATLDYISSAGLRVLLGAQKTMSKQGEMLIANPNESVNEVFEITGFTDILTII